MDNVCPSELSIVHELPSQSEFLERAWDVKQEIYEEQDILAQDYSFFERVYRQCDVYLAQSGEDTIIGFVMIDSFNYMPFLGVHPEYQERGIGKALLDELFDVRSVISCHTRVSNDSAVNFYESQGFRISGRLVDYYDDGESAYELIRDN